MSSVADYEEYVKYTHLIKTLKNAVTEEDRPSDFLDFLRLCRKKGVLSYDLESEQVAMCQFVENTEGEERAVFGLRGCGKSELITEFYVVYCLIDNKADFELVKQGKKQSNINKRIIILKANDGLGKKHINKIKIIIDAFPNLFSKCFYNSTSIHFEPRPLHGQDNIKVLIASSPSSLKTSRADFAVFDDVENHADFRSLATRNATAESIAGVLGMFAVEEEKEKSKNYIVVGQIAHPKGYHNSLKQRQDFKVFELWQDIETLHPLIKDDLSKVEQTGILLDEKSKFAASIPAQLSLWKASREIFYADYLGVLTESLANPFASVSTINYQLPIQSNVILALDPAYEGRDTTALSGVYTSSNKYFIFGKVWNAPYAEVLGEVVQTYFDLMAEVKKANLRVSVPYAVHLFYEGNGGAGSGIAELLRMRKVRAKKILNTQNKIVRISGLLPYMFQSVFYDTPDTYEYLRQIRQYNPNDSRKSYIQGYNDDAIDSLATCFRCAGIIK